MDSGSPPPSIFNQRYIEYTGIIDINAVECVTDFIYRLGDPPSIDTIKKAIYSICAIRDDELSLGKLEYMDAFGNFISISKTQLENYLADYPPDENGLSSNGGDSVCMYFGVQHFTFIEKWTGWEESEEEGSDGDGEEESDGDSEEEENVGNDKRRSDGDSDGDSDSDSDGDESEEKRWWLKK
jgi:hypothetical protein